MIRIVQAFIRRYNQTFYCYQLFFFNDTAATEIYTLSLHDALPIWGVASSPQSGPVRRAQWYSAGERQPAPLAEFGWAEEKDRKSTRLNSSHVRISYAVFCLKKKKKAISTL